MASPRSVLRLFWTRRKALLICNRGSCQPRHHRGCQLWHISCRFAGSCPLTPALTKMGFSLSSYCSPLKPSRHETAKLAVMHPTVCFSKSSCRCKSRTKKVKPKVLQRLQQLRSDAINHCNVTTMRSATLYSCISCPCDAYSRFSPPPPLPCRICACESLCCDMWHE